MKNWLEKCKKVTEEVPLSNIQKVSIGGLFILFGITFVQSQLSQLLEEYADLMLSAVLPSVIVELTNEERVDKNLNSLVHSEVLDETARRKAEHMRDNEYFAHDSPDGVEPWHWFDEVGYDYVHAGENLAIYFDESDEVVEAWMESPLHRDNVLKNEYKEIGVAAVEGEYKGFDTIFVVQHFGTPAKKVLAEEVEEVEVPVVETPEDIEVPEVVLEEEQAPIVPALLPVEVLAPEPEVVVEQVTTVLTQGDMTVYVSDHDATSTNKEEDRVIVPASTNNTSIPLTKTPNENTTNIMNMMYLLLSIAVAVALTVSTIHHQKHGNKLQVAYGIALLLVATLFMSFHTYVVEAFTIF